MAGLGKKKCKRESDKRPSDHYESHGPRVARSVGDGRDPSLKLNSAKPKKYPRRTQRLI